MLFLFISFILKAILAAALASSKNSPPAPVLAAHPSPLSQKSSSRPLGDTSPGPGSSRQVCQIKCPSKSHNAMVTLSSFMCLCIQPAYLLYSFEVGCVRLQSTPRQSLLEAGSHEVHKFFRPVINEHFWSGSSV